MLLSTQGPGWLDEVEVQHLLGIGDPVRVRHGQADRRRHLGEGVLVVDPAQRVGVEVDDLAVAVEQPLGRLARPAGSAAGLDTGTHTSTPSSSTMRSRASA